MGFVTAVLEREADIVRQNRAGGCGSQGRIAQTIIKRRFRRLDEAALNGAAELVPFLRLVCRASVDI